MRTAPAVSQTGERSTSETGECPTPGGSAESAPAVDASAEEAAPVTPDDLDYVLPPDAIAQSPLDQRDQARLLVDCGDRILHRRVSDLPELLGPGDAVVVNDTRVLPARLRMRRATGGAVEVLLLAQRADGDWEALVRPSRRLRPGELVVPASSPGADADGSGVAGGLGAGSGVAGGPGAGSGVAGGLGAGSGVADGPGAACGSGVVEGSDASAGHRPGGVEIGEDLGEGRRVVRLRTGDRSPLGLLDDIGEVPLPPYITSQLSDPERYQTVYGRRPISAAAPTAGLHFTEALLGRVRAAGAEVVSVELAVGLDTFRPMTADRLDGHVMHTEYYRVPPTAQAALARAERVVAVGTTAVRALETWAATGEESGHSSLFIRRPYRWRAVDVLMTNFHLPRSTLLCMLDAFVGPRWRTLYEAALEHRYRFLSFGDAMLVSRSPVARPDGAAS